MRVVESDAQLAESLPVARREAKAAFGNDEVYLEKLVRRARHVEVQILGDSHGNLVHLFERDCSVQRRNQKVVERAPAVSLSDAQRAELCEAALAIGRAVELSSTPARSSSCWTPTPASSTSSRSIRASRSSTPSPNARPASISSRRRSASPTARASATPESGVPRAGGDPDQGARAAVPRDDRGPGQQLHARLRPHHRLSLPGGLRHPPRRRHRLYRRGHHALLRFAAGEGDGLGADAGGDRSRACTARCGSSASAAS